MARQIDIRAMRDFMEGTGVKMRWVAEQAGMTENAMTLAMNSKRQLKAGEYASICGVLGVPLDQFIKAV